MPIWQTTHGEIRPDSIRNDDASVFATDARRRASFIAAVLSSCARSGIRLTTSVAPTDAVESTCYSDRCLQDRRAQGTPVSCILSRRVLGTIDGAVKNSTRFGGRRTDSGGA
jgi:hypothetical protein